MDQVRAQSRRGQIRRTAARSARMLFLSQEIRHSRTPRTSATLPQKRPFAEQMVSLVTYSRCVATPNHQEDRTRTASDAVCYSVIYWTTLPIANCIPLRSLSAGCLWTSWPNILASNGIRFTSGSTVEDYRRTKSVGSGSFGETRSMHGSKAELPPPARTRWNEHTRHVGTDSRAAGRYQ